MKKELQYLIIGSVLYFTLMTFFSSYSGKGIIELYFLIAGFGAYFWYRSPKRIIQKQNQKTNENPIL